MRSRRWTSLASSPRCATIMSVFGRVFQRSRTRWRKKRSSQPSADSIFSSPYSQGWSLAADFSPLGWGVDVAILIRHSELVPRLTASGSRRRGVDARPLWRNIPAPPHPRESAEHEDDRDELCRRQAAGEEKPIVLCPEELDKKTLDSREHAVDPEQPTLG